MTPGEDTLFRLIRIGLGLDRTAEGVVRDPVDWTTVYSLASTQGVLAIVWDGVQSLIGDGRLSPEQQPDKSLRLRWAYNVEQLEAKYARQKGVIAELAAFYSAHDIRMSLLKGYGLSLNYPVPKHRPCGDIDIWLYGKQEEADRLLHAEKGIYIDEDVHHHTVFHLNGVMIENHFDFLNVHAHLSNRRIERHLKKLAEHPGEKVSVGSSLVYLPSPDFNALFLLRHAAAHFAAAEIGLRHLTDWVMFIERYHDQVDWVALERMAREENMHCFLHCLHAIAIDYLGMDASFVPSFERDALLERRVLNNIFYPEFVESSSKGNIVKRLSFRFRRWWANRWKHRIVYREGLLITFVVQIWSHLLKPKSLK